MLALLGSIEGAAGYAWLDDDRAGGHASDLHEHEQGTPRRSKR